MRVRLVVVGTSPVAGHATSPVACLVSVAQRTGDSQLHAACPVIRAGISFGRRALWPVVCEAGKVSSTCAYTIADCADTTGLSATSDAFVVNTPATTPQAEMCNRCDLLPQAITLLALQRRDADVDPNA